MLKAHIPTDEGNRAAKAGTLGKTMRKILADQKPEAAYFVEECGERTAILFVNVKAESDIPRVAEPWFLAFKADVELHPAMTLNDLAEAGSDIEKAAKKFG